MKDLGPTPVNDVLGIRMRQEVGSAMSNSSKAPNVYINDNTGFNWYEACGQTE